MNPLIRLLSADSSRMDDVSYLTNSVHPPTCANSVFPRQENTCSVEAPALANGMAVAAPEATFATVMFVREDHTVGEAGHHVATMRVPLPSPDTTVWQLAKEAMRRLTHVLRRQQRGAADCGGPVRAEGTGRETAFSSPFVGVAQVLVDSRRSALHIASSAAQRSQTPATEGDGGGDRSASPLPPSEVFSADLVRQVAVLSEEVFVMRLRPRETARRAGAAGGGAIRCQEPLVDTTSSHAMPSGAEPPRNKRRRPDPQTESSDSEEDSEEEPHPLRRLPMIGDADVEMVAMELRSRAKNRLGWGPDAHKNFDSNYVPSPQKLMARPRRGNRRQRAKVKEQAEAEPEEARQTAPQPSSRTPVMAAASRAPSHSTCEPPAEAAESEPTIPLTQMKTTTTPVMTELTASEGQPQTTAKPVVTALDITGSFRHTPATVRVGTDDRQPHMMPLSAHDKGPQPLADAMACTATSASGRTGSSSPEGGVSPVLCASTPPEQVTARCLQWEESSGSRADSTANSQRRSIRRSLFSQSSPNADDGAPVGAPPEVSCHSQVALTPSAHGRPTKKGSPFPLRSHRVGASEGPLPATEPKPCRAADVNAAEGVTPLPKGWGGEASKFFDPATYCDNPEQARIAHRSPIRARRNVELPAYFALLDTTLPDSVIKRRLSQMQGGSLFPLH